MVEAVNYLKVRSCLIDGEVVCCHDRGLARFDLLRHRSNEANAILYAFDLLELDGADLRREPIEVRKATLASILGRQTGREAERAPTRLRADCLPARLPARLRGHRLQAARLALPLGPVSGLVEVKNPQAPAVRREAEDWSQ